MLKFWIGSSVLYFVFSILSVSRFFAINGIPNNKKPAKKRKCKLLLDYLRIIIIGLLPIINTVLGILFLYCFLCNEKNFNKITESTKNKFYE